MNKKQWMKILLNSYYGRSPINNDIYLDHTSLVSEKQLEKVENI